MAWIINKPIIAVIGSRDIKFVNFDLYLDKNNIAQIVTGGARGVDSLIETWAKQNDLEWVCYLPNYTTFGEKAPLVRDKLIVDSADELVAFWNGHSSGTLYTINYAKSIGKKITVHLIEER